jgi:hypothetical protein
LRSKINLWGNNGGASALGLLPFVKFPTNQDQLGNNAIEGGLLVPFAFDLPLGLDAGLVIGAAAARNDADNNYHTEFVNTFVLGRGLTEKIGVYAEFWSLASTETGADWQGTFDFGFNYLISDNLKLDAGVNIGVTLAADDWNPFVGLSWRY